jgi:hypothetical protein
MSGSIVSFRGYNVEVSIKKEKVVFDNSNTAWSDTQIAEIAYKAAEIVYNKQRWDRTKYDIDDFKQDAAMYILDKFKAGYFDGSTPDIGPIVYRLLNGHYVYNQYRSTKRVRDEAQLNDPVEYMPELGSLGRRPEYLDLVQDERPTPEEYSIHEKAISAGEHIVNYVVDKLNTQPFNTRKHAYVGYIDDIEIPLTESIVGKLIVEGKTLHEILDIYGYHDVTNAGLSSQTAYIAKVIKRTTQRIADIVASLSDTEKECAESYLRFSLN